MYDLEYTLKIADKYCKEAEKCYKNNCFVGSFVLYSAALESFLLAICFIYPRKVRKTKEYKKIKKESSRERGFFLEFNLEQLINISKKMGWLPTGEMVKDISIFKDWVEQTQEARNLIHASRWLKARPYFENLYQLPNSSCEEEYEEFINLSRKAVSEIRDIILRKTGKF